MNHTIRSIRITLRKIAALIKTKQQPLSLILVVGKHAHGKTALLNQTNLEQVLIQTEPALNVYYNQQGIVLELAEAWFKTSPTFFASTLKAINNCHAALKINGVMLCLDINALFHTEPAMFTAEIKSYAYLLECLGQALGYKTNLAIIFTKVDALAGFCDFYQNEHVNELDKPLGFALHGINDRSKLIDSYRSQFEQFVEVLGQQVIHKMHPVRSTIKRSLIREFPLQLATLRVAIQALLQHISVKVFAIQTLYFTSSEQGGLSLDRLSKKIQNEYALSVQDTFSQATNYRAYFISGALSSFQALSKQHAQPKAHLSTRQIASIVASGGLVAMIVLHQYLLSSSLLDKTNQELRNYAALSHKKGDDDTALYHLSKAATTLAKITSNSLIAPTIKTLKNEITQSTQHDLASHFIPNRLLELETVINDSHLSLNERYTALKIYLMFNQPDHFAMQEVLAWFKQQWQKKPQITLEKNLAILVKLIKQPLQPYAIKQQVVRDARNYLNALPADYLYYSLMKTYLNSTQQPLAIDGFQLSTAVLPFAFTKQGFQQIIKEIPTISATLTQESWVLAGSQLGDLKTLLQNAYCHEYVTWWNNFLTRSTPMHAESYQQASTIAETIYQSKALERLIMLAQQNVSPEQQQDHARLFNQTIASHFTEFSLISRSAIKNVTETIDELAKFLNTIAIIHDQGKTVFSLVRARFTNDSLANPISSLYVQAQHLPKPLALWVENIANDTWYLFIKQSRAYLNQKWQNLVFQEYSNHIAHRYPFEPTQTQDVSIADFNRFFSTHGVLTQFVDNYVKPFLDTHDPQWKTKELNHLVMPISSDAINELIRANIIQNMFFPNKSDICEVEFSLQKITLDPVVSSLQFMMGNTTLKDTQSSDSGMAFHWPEPNAKLSLNAIDGNHFELEESGPWAFFKLLGKINVLVDEENSANLEIHFEINGNSGRYLLKTANQINPFSPGVLTDFALDETIT